MNMRIAAVLLAAVCTAHASTVEFYLTNFNVSALNNIITLIPQGPVTSGNTVISGLPIRIQPTNSFASTNLLTGRYQFQLQGITFPKALYVVVPDDALTYSAAELITNNLVPSGAVIRQNFATTNIPSTLTNIITSIAGASGGADKLATNNGTSWGQTLYNPTFADEVGSATINELSVSGAIILTSDGNILFGTNGAALLTYAPSLLTWRIPMTFTNAAGATVAFLDIHTNVTTTSQTAVAGWSLPAATNKECYVEIAAVVDGFSDTYWARITYDANGVATIDDTNSILGLVAAAGHSPVALTDNGGYMSLVDQVLTANPIDLSGTNVTGSLPLGSVDNTNLLAFASQLADYLALTETNDFAAGITNAAWAATQAATNGLGGGGVTAAELISATNLIHEASTNSAKSYADATFVTSAQLAAATNNAAQTWDSELLDATNSIYAAGTNAAKTYADSTFLDLSSTNTFANGITNKAWAAAQATTNASSLQLFLQPLDADLSGWALFPTNTLGSLPYLSTDGTNAFASDILTSAAATAAAKTNLSVLKVAGSNIVEVAWHTNGINTGVLPLGQATFTNLTADISIAGFSGLNAALWQPATLIATNGHASSNYKITLPSGCSLSTNTFCIGQDVWVTNRSKVIIAFGLGFGDTNAAANRWPQK